MERVGFEYKVLKTLRMLVEAYGEAAVKKTHTSGMRTILPGPEQKEGYVGNLR
jgi:hypothetical protein